jgi:hypothetical protein
VRQVLEGRVVGRQVRAILLARVRVAVERVVDDLGWGWGGGVGRFVWVVSACGNERVDAVWMQTEGKEAPAYCTIKSAAKPHPPAAPHARTPSAPTPKEPKTHDGALVHVCRRHKRPRQREVHDGPDLGLRGGAGRAHVGGALGLPGVGEVAVEVDAEPSVYVIRVVWGGWGGRLAGGEWRWLPGGIEGTEMKTATAGSSLGARRSPAPVAALAGVKPVRVHGGEQEEVRVADQARRAVVLAVVLAQPLGQLGEEHPVLGGMANVWERVSTVDQLHCTLTEVQTSHPAAATGTSNSPPARLVPVHVGNVLEVGLRLDHPRLV